MAIVPTINTTRLTNVSMQGTPITHDRHLGNTSWRERAFKTVKRLHTHAKKRNDNRKQTSLLTLLLSLNENAVKFFGHGAGTSSPSVQQSLQRSALPRLVLAGQAGAATRRVHSTRLSLTEGARHAAAAAGIPHPLRAVLRQRLAQKQRPGVARLASDHRPHGAGEPNERSQCGGDTKHAGTGHSADLSWSQRDGV